MTLRSIVEAGAVRLLSEVMKTVRSLLVACMTLGCATAVATVGCAERPGKKKEDENKDKDGKKDGKADAKADDAKKDDAKAKAKAEE